MDAEAQAPARIRLQRTWFADLLVPRCSPVLLQLGVWIRVATAKPPSVQSPFAHPRYGRGWQDVEHLVGRHYPSIVAHTGSCASPIPSPPLRFPYRESLRRLLPAPAGNGTFPTLSLQSLCRRLDPYPAALLGCMYPFLSQGHRPHATGNAFGARNYRCNATSTASRISGLQSFAYLQSPTLTRPPSRTYRDRLSPAWQSGRLHHA